MDNLGAVGGPLLALDARRGRSAFERRFCCRSSPACWRSDASSMRSGTLDRPAPARPHADPAAGEAGAGGWARATDGRDRSVRVRQRSGDAADPARHRPRCLCCRDAPSGCLCRRADAPGRPPRREGTRSLSLPRVDKKQTARRFVDEAVNGGRDEVVDELFTSNTTAWVRDRLACFAGPSLTAWR